MKTRLLLFAMLLCCLTRVYAGEINALNLHLASGKQVTVLLDEQPVVTFVGDELVITTPMNRMSYRSADVLKFTYAYVNPDDVTGVKASGTKLIMKENTLQATSLEPSSKVEVYGVDGILVATTTTDKNGNASVDLSRHPGKVFVIKTSVANFKIIKP